MQKIMIIEDDSAIREELALLLENEGYTSLPVINFDGIPEQAERVCPDLILLDIGLPGRDGFSLCAALRKAVSASVIFVTSRDAGADEVRALSLGGDDYITNAWNHGHPAYLRTEPSVPPSYSYDRNRRRVDDGSKMAGFLKTFLFAG